MSKNIVDLIKFRQSALDNSSKDDVLEISHLFRDSIDPVRFFSESYFTEGIDVLLKTAFARFAGQDDHGVVKLTQNMGGGKTHSMITLGLLAKHPEHRKRFLGENSFEGDVRVIGFTGRQTDTNLGIWGELAKQLGKEEDFKEYYNPQFAAPGSEAWITMLQGTPTLILLDEIPPYLVNAKSKTVGNSDLSQVTGIALSNLFNALNDSRLSNVLIVVADLAGSHAEGSEMIKEVIKNLGSEMRRVSLDLTPVNNQSNELVEILKTKLIEVIPSEDAIREVADEYKKVLTEAKQMGLVNVEPAQFASLIVKNYPFHPSFIDLYNRFKENEGFQQTRGVIRLVRSMVQDIHETKTNLQLISPQDINLSNQRLRTEIEQLNPSLAPATRHDIHNLDGNSVAQLNSAKRGDVLVEDIARLLLVSSLSSVPNGLKGLNETEITAIIARPGVKVTDIRSAREQLFNEAWYLATDKDNRLFFQQNQNLNAQLKALVESYDEESARKEVRAYLESELKPTVGDLYQKVQVFPGIEELDINAKQVTLIVTEPSHFEEGLSHEVRQYWSEHSYKNRFLFLSGERQTWDSLIEAFKELKAVNTVISVMIDERVSENDPQYKKAIDKRDKTYIQITSAVRETFITLYFPRGDNGGDRLDKTEISFQFTGNNFDAEKQIRAALIEERKFSTSQDIESASFRDKVEERLFGPQQKEINWNDLLNNAAANCAWSWHHPNALNDLRSRALQEGYWRDNGGYIERGPFAKEPTSVEINSLDYDRDTKETTLKLTAKYGDKIYFDTNENVSEQSKLVENPDFFKVKSRNCYFLCVDSRGEHDTGASVRYQVPFQINHDFRSTGNGQEMTLQVNNDAEIRYTTDSSDPRQNGGIYDSVITVPQGTRFIRVVAHLEDDYGTVEDLQVPSSDNKVTIDDHKPLEYNVRTQTSDNAETYTMLDKLAETNTKISPITVGLTVGGDSNNYVSIALGEKVELTSDQIRQIIKNIREVLSADEQNISIELTTRKLKFQNGTAFKQYADYSHIDIAKVNPNDISQK